MSHRPTSDRHAPLQTRPDLDTGTSLMAISLWTVTTNQWMYMDVWYTVVFYVQTYKTYQDMSRHAVFLW